MSACLDVLGRESEAWKVGGGRRRGVGGGCRGDGGGVVVGTEVAGSGVTQVAWWAASWPAFAGGRGRGAERREEKAPVLCCVLGVWLGAWVLISLRRHSPRPSLPSHTACLLPPPPSFQRRADTGGVGRYSLLPAALPAWPHTAARLSCVRCGGGKRGGKCPRLCCGTAPSPPFLPARALPFSPTTLYAPLPPPLFTIPAPLLPLPASPPPFPSLSYLSTLSYP